VAAAIQRTSAEALLIDHGSLYPALQRLEQAGLITSEWGISDKNRRARFYKLTRAGRMRLAAETSKWQKMVRAVSRILKPAKQEALCDFPAGCAGAPTAAWTRRSVR
jgi:transcriptional regulator